MTLDMNALLFGTVRRMHSVQRYSSLPVLRPENVAEHSWQIAFISWAIGTELNEQSGFRRPVNMLILLQRAMFHDLSEVLSGDIIRSFKHSSPRIRNAINDADTLNMTKLVEEICGEKGLGESDLAAYLYTHWQEAKDESTEGRIVALADILCVVSYCQEEHALGSRKLDRVLRHMFETTLYPFWQVNLWARPFIDPIFPHGKWDDPYNADHLMIGSSQTRS